MIQLFKKGSIQDLEALEMRQLSFKYIMLNDSVWTPLEHVMLKTPFSRDNLLKKTKFLQKEDSLGVYLIAVKNVLKRNDLAPKKPYQVHDTADDFTSKKTSVNSRYRKK